MKKYFSVLAAVALLISCDDSDLDKLLVLDEANTALLTQTVKADATKAESIAFQDIVLSETATTTSATTTTLTYTTTATVTTAVTTMEHKTDIINSILTGDSFPAHAIRLVMLISTMTAIFAFLFKRDQSEEEIIRRPGAGDRTAADYRCGAGRYARQP